MMARVWRWIGIAVPVTTQRVVFWRAGVTSMLWLVLAWSALASEAPIEKTVQKGPVEAVVTLEPSEPLIGDTVNLVLRVVADKGVELLMPEFGQALERFAILDFSLKEQIDAEGRTVVTQQYQLQPARSGRQSIPPLMIEFVDRREGATPAPEGFDAYELLTERLSFSVGSVLPDDAAVDLHPPLGAIPLHVSKDPSIWPRVIVGLILLFVMGFFAWYHLALSRKAARRRSAYEIASARLAKLLRSPSVDPDQIDVFFVELSSIVRQYLEDRFELRAPELTTEEFLEQMSGSPDLSSDHQPLLRQFLSRADLVKFANVVPTEADIEQSVDAARTFLDETGQKVSSSDHSVNPSNTGGAVHA